MRFILGFLLSTISFASIAQVKTTILNSDQHYCEIKFQFENYTIQESGLKDHKLISIPGTIQTNTKGEPQLPQYNFSVQIPQNKTIASIDVRNLEDASPVNEIRSDIKIAPAKGSIVRTVRKENVPFSFGNIYQNDGFYPQQIGSIKSTYFIRDIEGASIAINPVQYNPIRQECKLYTDVIVKIFFKEVTTNAVEQETIIPAVFDGIYKNHFINYPIKNSEINNKYTPINDMGSMLVICDPDYKNAIEPFLEWKNNKGQVTYLAMSDTINGGITEASIAATVKNYYNNNKIAFALIVGDDNDIPSYNNDFVSPVYFGSSDNGYAYLSGDDHFADIIIGRMSGDNNNDIEGQVFKTLQQEMSPNTLGEWMSTCIAIGSNDPTNGDDLQYDWQHQRAIADTLILGPYTKRKEFFDGDKNGDDGLGNPTPFEIANAINDGASIINYTGHGSVLGLVTGTFSSNEIPLMKNYNKIWPVCMTVGCRPGYFINFDCFGESAMIARDSANRPTGFLATAMSTVDQYWDEPMQAQDEANNILAGMYSDNIKNTFGGIFFNGMFSMIENYNTVTITDGSDMADSWQFFGDPSVQLFTANEGKIVLTTACVVDPNNPVVEVGSNIADATIAISKNGKLLSSMQSNGVSNSIELPIGSVAEFDTLTIVATKYNHVPFIGTVLVSTDVNACDIKSFVIYPNPSANGNFNIKSPKPIVSIKTYDVSGRTMQYQKIDNKKILLLNMQQQPSGAYIVEITTDDGDVRREWVVVR